MCIEHSPPPLPPSHGARLQPIVLALKQHYHLLTNAIDGTCSLSSQEMYACGAIGCDANCDQHYKAHSRGSSTTSDRFGFGSMDPGTPGDGSAFGPSKVRRL